MDVYDPDQLKKTEGDFLSPCKNLIDHWYP